MKNKKHRLWFVQSMINPDEYVQTWVPKGHVPVTTAPNNRPAGCPKFLKHHKTTTVKKLDYIPNYYLGFVKKEKCND